MKTLTLTLTPEQGQAVSAALDLFVRLGIGQLEEVAHLVRLGTIPAARPGDQPREAVSYGNADEIAHLLSEVKALLGYPANGSNGIGHPHVALAAHRAYEVKKVMDRALALDRDPTPPFPTVNYDGLLVRYTEDPAPSAVVDDKHPTDPVTGLELALGTATTALELIAAGPRPDGTYNRCREACQTLAADTLAKLRA